MFYFFPLSIIKPFHLKSLIHKKKQNMYILLRHFPFQNRGAELKTFDSVQSIERYMNSTMTERMEGIDEYAGKSIMQRKLTNSPDYDGVYGFISNDEETHGVVYKVDFDDELRGCFADIKFDTDTVGYQAPWISQLYAIGDPENDSDYLNPDNIENTNDLNSEDRFDNGHVVYLKFNVI